MAPGRRMNLIGLVQLGDAPDALEEKRNQGGVFGPGHVGKKGAETARIVRSHAGRQLHAGEDDSGGGIFVPGLADDGDEVGTGLRQREPAQAVVAPEFEHQDVHRPAQQPVHAAQSARRGVAADAGVDNCKWKSGRIGALLQQGRKGRAWIHPVARGQAVAEQEDDFPGPTGVGARRLQGKEGHHRGQTRGEAAEPANLRNSHTRERKRQRTRCQPGFRRGVFVFVVARCLAFPAGVSRRLLLIRNPRSAAGRDQRTRFARLVARLAATGFVVEERRTEAPGQALELAASLGGGCDVLLAVGGDGTIHEIASGLLRAGHNPALAIAPFGTGNDVATLLGLHGDEELHAALEHAVPQPMDTITVTCCGPEGGEIVRHALLFAAVGFAGELLRQTTPRVVRWFGPKLCYSVGFFRALFSYRPPLITARSGDLLEHGPLFHACAANAPHAGGTMLKLAPGARLADGRLNLCLIRQTGWFEAARQFPRLLRGTHIHHPKVRYFEGEALEVRTDPPVPVAVDGELVGRTPATFTVRPGSLRVFARNALA